MIDEIQGVIRDEFAKRKLEAYTKRLLPKDLHGWADQIAQRHQLEQEKFSVQVGEFFWAFAAIQMSLGYVFLSLKETSFPAGISGRTINDSEVPDLNQLADHHFWYHMFNTWESIYRLWERAVSVLTLRYTPNVKKQYFNNYVQLLNTHRHDDPLFTNSVPNRPEEPPATNPARGCAHRLPRVRCRTQTRRSG